MFLTHDVSWEWTTLPAVFVEALDKCFENVCELDLIFHSDKVGMLLNRATSISLGVAGECVCASGLGAVLLAIDVAATHAYYVEPRNHR